MDLSDIAIGDVHWQDTNRFRWARRSVGRSPPAPRLSGRSGPQRLSERSITWLLRESHSTRCRALQSAADPAFIGEASADEAFATMIVAGDDVLAQG